MNYGSPGADSMPHLIVGLLNKIAGSELKHIPYSGSAPGIQDLPYLQSGKLRLRDLAMKPA